MKTLYVSYTYLDVIQVPDEMTHEEICALLEENAPAEGWNDIEYTRDFAEEAANSGRN